MWGFGGWANLDMEICSRGANTWGKTSVIRGKLAIWRAGETNQQIQRAWGRKEVSDTLINI